MKQHNPPRTVAIVQARMGSTRLPGKVMMKLGRHTLFSYLVNRLRTSETLDETVLATTTHHRDDILVHEAESLGLRHYRGSEHDVLDRYRRAAIAFHADIVVRVTADNPFTDPFSIDRVVRKLQHGFDYAIENGLPVGVTGEALTFSALDFIAGVATTSAWREHVTLYAKDNPETLRTAFMDAPDDYVRPGLRFTVDTFEEYQQVRDIARAFSDPHFSLKDLISLADKGAVV